jgi:diguanylate cyclase (GGDEF)-like protein
MDDSRKLKTQKIEATPSKSTFRLPQLFVMQGPNVGDVYRLLRPEMIIGRDRDADIPLVHPSVSRRHARLSIKGEQVYITDLGSTNGTLIGVDRLRGRHQLRDGDVISVGIVAFLKLTYSLELDEVFRRAAYQSATRDGTTRVGNREYLLDRFRAEYGYARRHAGDLVLVFFRVDQAWQFAAKSPQLDDVMSAVAAIIHEGTRVEDVVTRSSRDEFIVILRSTPDQAASMAERVRNRVAEYGVTMKKEPLGTTVTAAVVPVFTGARPPGSLEALTNVATSIIMGATTIAHGAMEGRENQVVHTPSIDSAQP